MKPFDDMELPVGTITDTTLKIPPYPLFECALGYVNNYYSTYFIIEMDREVGCLALTDVQGSHEIDREAFETVFGRNAGMVYSTASPKAFLFDCNTRKGYFMIPDKAKEFLGLYRLNINVLSGFELVSQNLTLSDYLDPNGTREQMDLSEKFLTELKNWYETERRRKDKKAIKNILVGDDPIEVVFQLVETAKRAVQDTQLILKSANLADETNNYKLHSFFYSLEELKADLALLEAYANYELDRFN